MILVTGAAGFIGFHFTKKLLEEGYEVIGLDNINAYYSQKLKFDRLDQLGISSNEAVIFNQICQSSSYQNFTFIRMDLIEYNDLSFLFRQFSFTKVINLAAQVGVRNSIDNPKDYVESNIMGFINLLECCKEFHIEHLLYASSSSVYGNNEKAPFSVEDNVDHPISLYAATKKSNELLAHVYSHLYKIKTVGLRFFNVYGPWGRPDMAISRFTKAILEERPIKVFNHGKLERDFTYVSDIVDGMVLIFDNMESREYYSIVNIGHGKPVKLPGFIEELEKQLSKRAKVVLDKMQPGDMERTWADIDPIMIEYNFRPKIGIQQGVSEYLNWYRKYHFNDVF